MVIRKWLPVGAADNEYGCDIKKCPRVRKRQPKNCPPSAPNSETLRPRIITLISPGPSTTTCSTTKPTPTRTKPVQATAPDLSEINQLMADLSQYNDPATQQALAAARQALSAATGDKNIGSADQAAIQADLNTAGRI